MKTYVVIAFIALGLLFSPTPIMTINYDCAGGESLPTYYASPFIYKSTSLATSLAFDYYVLGFIGSWLTWCLAIWLIWFFLNRFLDKENKVLAFIYSASVGIVIFFSVMSMVFATQTTGGSTVRWNIDLEMEAKESGVQCSGVFKVTGR